MKFLETGYFFSSNAVVSTTWSLVSMIAVRASSAVAAPNARFSRPSTASRPFRTSGEALYAINFWSTLLNFLTRRSSVWKRKRIFISYSNCVTSSLQWLTVTIQFTFKKKVIWRIFLENTKRVLECRHLPEEVIYVSFR